MRILHTESSIGWGGQEIRILKESIGMRKRGHTVVIAASPKSRLLHYARQEGFIAHEICFRRLFAPILLWKLIGLIRKHQIDIVNTHSSRDAWMGGMAARLTRCPVIRTRHLSTPVRGGLNAILLYRTLADFVVTTSSPIIPIIASQAGVPLSRFRCIPTGVEPFEVNPAEVEMFRRQLHVGPDDILIGTVCVVRSWKGIQDLIQAASLLNDHRHLKWVVIGGGYIHHFQHLVGPHLPFTFTGHLENPAAATAALDIFALLSTAHEGISQASLQAAYLRKPLLTTPIGGLPEVCLDGITGLQLPASSPADVAKGVVRLASDAPLRHQYGRAGRALVEEKFLLSQTIDQMEQVLGQLKRGDRGVEVSR